MDQKPSQIPPPEEMPPSFSLDGTPPPATSKSRKDKESIKSIVSTIAILVIAPIIALTLTAYVFQSYEVDGPSMETTLQNSDRLIVLKLQRTIARITRHSYLPNRGDVVIFNKNDLPEFGGTTKKQLIKRVIALPGEEVEVKDGVVIVYNKEHPEGFQPDKSLPYGGVIIDTPGTVERFKIPAGHIYVCGDNRVNSLDSRAFGPISLDDVVGKLIVRIFPFNKTQTF